MKPVMYKPKQVAEIFSCTPAHIRNMCKRNEIPHKKLGDQYRIPIKWVEENTDGIQA